MQKVKSGILLGDQRADALFLLTDKNGDGDAIDAGERQVFFDDSNASGLESPSRNIFSVTQASDKSVYVGDGSADAVYRLQDLNRDGDANDAGEAVAWFDAENAEGLALVTPNGIAEGADGAIYITNAGVSSSPADAVYRTEDLNGDGDANDAGESTVWLDLQTIELAGGGTLGAASVPFDIVFNGDVAYVNDLTGADVVDIIHRVEDLDGNGSISVDEVTPFITDAANFGAPVDLTSAVQGDSLLTLTWFPDSSVPGAQPVVYRLTDLDGSKDINSPDEAVEVWNAAALPEGYDMFVGFNIETDEDGKAYLTADEHVVTLTDLNGDGDYLDDGETQILTSGQDDPDVIRPRALSTYEETVPQTATTLGGGNHFSLFLDKAENKLFASGENVLGQLGIGVKGYDIKTPVEVTLPEDFEGTIASVSAGLIHGSFLTEAGDVYTWGFGNLGRLGHGDNEDQLIPKKVEALDDANIVQIENGNGVSYAVDDEGNLYAWGQNSNGQLGQGDEVHRNLPTKVAALDDETVVDVSSGTSHTLVLTADGDVYAFGSNIDGQIGSPAGLDEDGQPIREILSPLRVEGLPDNVVSITADTKTSFAVTADGKVYGWGENKFGQIGVGTDNGDGTFTPNADDILTPTLIEGLPDNVVDVQGGARWVIALTEDGDVYAWGPNDVGPTGGLDGDPAAESDGTFFPTKIAGLDNVNVVEIASGPNSIIAVADDGTVFTFGSNSDGRLGYSSDGSVYEPQAVDFTSDPAPFLVSTTPADNARDVPIESALTFTFTEAVFAGGGSIRLVNRDDPLDWREIGVDDQRFVSFNGDSVTVTPSAFLMPGARYAVEFDTGAFVDADGNPVVGFESGDTASYNFRVDDVPNDLPISERGGSGDDFLRGAEGDDDLRGLLGDDLLFGNGGDDSLWGDRGDDEMDGGAGDDRLVGDRGDDTLRGGAGNDEIDGGRDDDLVDGGLGDDGILGGRGDDTLLGGAGKDNIDGGRNDDLIEGGDGDDSLMGGRGEDQIFGDDGDDHLRGDRGDDILMGGAGDDKIRGDRGDDFLDGGAGNDTLRGGSGEDTFFFDALSGHDVITDFETTWFSFFGEEDTLRLDIEGVDSKWDLVEHLDRDGRDLVLNFAEDTSLTFKDTSILDFVKMEIEFV